VGRLAVEARSRERARSRDRHIGTSESRCRKDKFPERREAKERVNVDFPRSRESGKGTFDVGTRERRDSESLPQASDKGEARVEETVGYELPIREGRAPTLRAVDCEGPGGATVLAEGQIKKRNNNLINHNKS
jgi:hypothetical protein